MEKISIEKIDQILQYVSNKIDEEFNKIKNTKELTYEDFAKIANINLYRDKLKEIGMTDKVFEFLNNKVIASIMMFNDEDKCVVIAFVYFLPNRKFGVLLYDVNHKIHVTNLIKNNEEEIDIDKFVDIKVGRCLYSIYDGFTEDLIRQHINTKIFEKYMEDE